MSGGVERRRGLGRGLEALLAESPGPGGDGTRQLPIEFLEPSRYQPRRRFDDEEMAALTASVRAIGILQPLLVRPLDDLGERYEIVAGERRWRAAQAAGLADLPVVVRPLSDGDALEAALLENVQRADLGPLEEADGYRRLIEQFGHTQEVLAERVGKSRPHIANLLRLLALPEPVKAMLDDGRLTAGHARALLGTADPVSLAKLVVEKGLNVRQTEALAKAGARRPARPSEPDPDVRDLEHRIANELGLAVELKTKGHGGRITIAWSSPEQLDRLLERLV
ncbi:MAG: ParB/RepB/Spo0J family partition protein [Pseudomonadota bacterium]